MIFIRFYFKFSLPHKIKLFDRISSQVMSPSRVPPGDAIGRCRDAVESIQAATSHKYSRDRAELVHLLGSPHIQVSDDYIKPSNLLSTHPKIHKHMRRVLLFVLDVMWNLLWHILKKNIIRAFCHHHTHERTEIETKDKHKWRRVKCVGLR